MANRYKQRNFGAHHSCVPVFECPRESLEFSNSLYDKNKGLTHYFLHTAHGEKDDEVRLIGDVEIAMSQSPAVTSEFSPDYRQKLAMGLMSQHGSGPSGLTDEQLFTSVPSNVALERDEIANLAKSEINSLDLLASENIQPTEDTPPSPSVPTEVPPTPPTPAVS